MKRGVRLAVMTFVKRLLFRFNCIHGHLRKDYGAYVLDVDDLNSQCQQGFKSQREKPHTGTQRERAQVTQEAYSELTLHHEGS
jgi:hypothetical protein